jgi:hypothetical protein
MKNTKIGYIYRDADKRRRIHGIYAPGLDRFIFVDYSDVWVTLETAEILSSKLPTMAYVLHTINFDFNSENCTNYTITNKTNQVVSRVSIVNRRQTPCLMFAPYATNPIEYVGQNMDYVTPEKQEMIRRLQEYAQYVNDIVYVIRITNAMVNWTDGQSFIDKYVPSEFTNTIDGPMSHQYDRSSTERGVFFEIRHALYISQTIEEAEQRIIDIWILHHHEQEYLLTSFYRNLGREVPQALSQFTVYTPVTISPSLL